MKAQIAHFTGGKPSWTKNNEIVYKLYLTSPKKRSRPVLSFHILTYIDDDTGFFPCIRYLAFAYSFI